VLTDRATACVRFNVVPVTLGEAAGEKPYFRSEQIDLKDAKNNSECRRTIAYDNEQ
jgi:hypothetical protein